MCIVLGSLGGHSPTRPAEGLATFSFLLVKGSVWKCDSSSEMSPCWETLSSDARNTVVINGWTESKMLKSGKDLELSNPANSFWQMRK